MNQIVSFGEWVAQRRKSLDMTQRELAARSTCALATIKKIEAGERRPSRELAELLADPLCISVDKTAVFVECARGLRRVDVLAGMTRFSPDERQRPTARSAANLPASATPFIGRALEVAQIVHLLEQPACRLLTLVGTGGAGKTRLALEAARAQRDRIADGVVFVSLAAVTDPSFMPMAIAHGLNLALAESAEAQLFAYLQDKIMLLVLDNCEQLGEGIGWLSVLLANAPGVKLLATSRERLQLVEEWLYIVPKLDEGQAIALFEQTAQRLTPHLQSSEQRASVSRVCQLVEQLPLAIELAASWTPFLSCEQIAHNLQSPIDFLSANLRNVPERHRSIRAVFDHSWRLLSPVEQQVLTRLSVFRGGWTVDEAEPIAGATLQILRTLSEKSLVRTAGPGRYDLHELVRQYAADQLNAAGQAEQTQRHHSEVYLRLTAQLDAQLHGPDGIAAFARLEQEHDNIRAGIGWALTAGEIAIARQYIDCLFIFWLRRGYWAEGGHWARAAVVQADEEDSILRCWMLVNAATFTALQLQYLEATSLREQATLMARRLEDPETTIRVLLLDGQALPDMEQVAGAFEHLFLLSERVGVFSKGAGAKQALLANAHSLYGDRLLSADRAVEAAAQYRQSLELFRQLGNSDMIAYPIGNLGRLALREGRVHEAADRFTESVAIARASDNRVGIIDWLQQLGNVALALGDLVQAEECYEEVLALCKEMGNRRAYVNMLVALGHVALIKGHWADCGQYLREGASIVFKFVEEIQSLPGAWNGWFPPEVFLCLQAIALLETAQGNFKRATTLFGAATTVQIENWYDRDLALQARVDEAIKTVQSQLAEEVFASAWESGRSLSLLPMLAFALSGDASASSGEETDPLVR